MEDNTFSIGGVATTPGGSSRTVETITTTLNGAPDTITRTMTAKNSNYVKRNNILGGIFNTNNRTLMQEFVMANNFMLILVVVLIIYLLFWCIDSSTSGFYTLSVIILLMVMYVHRSWMWMKDNDMIRVYSR